MSLNPGTKFGPYEIVGALGAGGMGEVYEAKDTRLGRRVAIKVLSPHLSTNESLRQRFEREAKSISSLAHPYICALHDVGEEGGHHYLVMEYLDGESLAERLTRGPLKTNEVVKYGAQIAEALGAAHRNGVVHRDLKPGNVMLTESGAKLLDFGLAKAVAEVGEAHSLTQSPTMATPLTTAGTLVGTYQYMSPEQLEGGEADARSDVFAFGATLYEMVTGQKAFGGKTQASVIAAVLGQEPPQVTSIQPMTPPALAQLIAQCLQKDPEERRQSMHDLALELRFLGEAGTQVGVPAPVVSRRKSRERLAWSLAGGFALATAAALAMLFLGGRGKGLDLSSDDGPALMAELLPPEGFDFNYDPVDPGPPVLSPDNRFLAFVAYETNSLRRYELYVRDLRDGHVRLLEGAAGAAYPFWSPDGDRIGYFENGYLWTIGLDGGRPIRLCEAGRGKGGTWREDGTILFAPSYDSGIHQVSSEGGDSFEVTRIDTTLQNSHRFPAFVEGRDDAFVYTVRRREEQNYFEVHWATLDGAEGGLLLESVSHAQPVGERLLFVRDNTLFSSDFDSGSMELTGRPHRLAEEVTVMDAAGRGLFSATSELLVYQMGGEQSDLRELVIYEQGGLRSRAVGEKARYSRPSFSPDGMSIAYEIDNNDDETEDIWIMDVTTGLPTRFTSAEGSEQFPLWSPDGSELAYAADSDGSWAIYARKLAGAQERRKLVDLPEGGALLDWSRDGKYLAIVIQGDIWTYDLGTERLEKFAASTEQFAEWSPSFSPDGKWIAFVSVDSGTPELYVTSFPEPGRRWRVSPNGGQGVSWAPDSRALYYVTAQAEVYEVAFRVRGEQFIMSTPKLLFQEIRARDGGMSPDAERFVLVLVPEAANGPTLRIRSQWRRANVRP